MEFCELEARADLKENAGGGSTRPSQYSNTLIPSKTCLYAGQKCIQRYTIPIDVIEDLFQCCWSKYDIRAKFDVKECLISRQHTSQFAISNLLVGRPFRGCAIPPVPQRYQRITVIGLILDTLGEGRMEKLEMKALV